MSESILVEMRHCWKSHVTGHIFSDLKNDPSRFESPGINFNAKLIGIDEISSARGDKMCQESIQRLKLAVKSSGQHKQKIIVNVSLEGVRLIDLRSQVSGIIQMQGLF